MRFLPPVAALADGAVALRRRPAGPRRARWARCSTRCARSASQVDDDGRGTLPFTVHGTRRACAAAPVTHRRLGLVSQFVSALLLAGARFDEGVDRAPRRQAGAARAAHRDDGRDAARRRRRWSTTASPNTWRVEPGRDQRRSTSRSSPTCPTPRRSSPPPLVTGGRVHRAGLAAAHHPGRRRAARHPRRDGRRRAASTATG